MCGQIKLLLVLWIACVLFTPTLQEAPVIPKSTAFENLERETAEKWKVFCAIVEKTALEIAYIMLPNEFNRFEDSIVEQFVTQLHKHNILGFSRKNENTYAAYLRAGHKSESTEHFDEFTFLDNHFNQEGSIKLERFFTISVFLGRRILSMQKAKP